MHVTENVMAETYRDLRGFLEAISRKHAQKYGGRFEDVRADADYYFVKAVRSHIAGMAPNEGWIQLVVSRGLLDCRRGRAISDRKYKTQLADHHILVEDRRGGLVDEIVERGTDDAREMVAVALDKVECGECHPKRKLRREMRKLGWCGDRIAKSFREVSRLVRESEEE